MPDLCYDLPVAASAERIFDAMTAAEGLNSWWTLASSGQPVLGEVYRFHFGAGYDWSGEVTACEPGKSFEWRIVAATEDWENTRVGFSIREEAEGSMVRFYHRDWRSADAHYRTTAFCWAMYLRLLKRFVERGEIVPYAGRLDA